MDFYDRLGVKKIINAQGYSSKLGGSLMDREVLDAMVGAAAAYVEIGEFLQKAGEHLARLIGVEAVLIVNSAAAGLAVATAACVTGRDPEKIVRLPDTQGMKNEVVVHRQHRNHYDGCVRQVGVRLVEIGLARETMPWELEKTITDRTAAVAYFIAYEGRNTLALPHVVRVARAAGVPVVVDAASEVPPVSNLRRYVDDGADLVVFSGGKGIRGPQASGLIVGRRELVACCALNAFPNQNTIGRAMKIGKEEIAGLVMAVERVLRHDFAADAQIWERRTEAVIEALRDVPGVQVRRVIDAPEDHELHPVPIPRAWIELPDVDARNAVVRHLGSGTPPIVVEPVGRRVLMVAPEPLQYGEEQIVAVRLREALLNLRRTDDHQDARSDRAFVDA
jgi:uncharacterized pyridoxal phosphate-dependent enzyme